MASRLQDVILRGTAAARPAATAVAPGTLYYSTDTSTTARSSGTAWETYADGGGGGGGGPHAATHNSGSTDPVTVTNLAGYPGGTVNFLRADGTFAVPPGSGSGALHATTHQPGGSDAMAVDAAAATGSLRTLGTSSTSAAAGNDPRLSDSRIPSLHASTHNNASSDPVNVTALAGYPGGTSNFLRADASFAAISIPARIGSISLLIDGGGSVITVGNKGWLEIPFACTIQAVTLLGDVSGSVVIDIHKNTYASFPAVGSITASAKPTISSAVKSQDITLTGWTTAIAAGDILIFIVDSVSAFTKLSLSLKIQAT